MATSFIPGDVKINKLMLHSDDGCRSYDLSSQCHYIDIYESILSPIIYAELVIEDSIDLARQFPLIAEEYVDIEFEVEGSATPVQYRLHVKGINNLSVSSQQKFKGYSISLVSMEMLKNANQNVSKKFEGDIATNIRTILDEYLQTSKKITIESTRGIDSVLITRMSPFKTIDMLRRRAVSKKYTSSAFVFYENKHGYNFETIESIYDRNKDGCVDREFTYSPTVKDDAKRNIYRNIISMHQVAFADSIDKIQQGGLSNKVGALDLVTGGYTVLNYTNNEAADQFVGSDKGSVGTNTSAFERLHGRNTSKTLFLPTASDRNESFLPNKISVLQAYAQRIAQNLAHIYIWGDSDLTAGDVITCHMPEATASTGLANPDRLASGKYIVSKLRHCITLGDRALYTQSLEIIKSNFLETA